MSPPASKPTVKKISLKSKPSSKSCANSTWNTEEETILVEKQGYFGNYGGRFVPETLVPALDELTSAYQALKTDAAFWQEFESLCHYYIGRPTPLYFAERLTAHCGGAKSCSNGKTWRIPAPIRLITPSARGCWPKNWARNALSPKPAPGSTAWPPPPSGRCWGWNV